jgi:hypothetical protein
MISYIDSETFALWPMVMAEKPGRAEDGMKGGIG